MKTSDQPPAAAVITAALFRGRNIVFLVLGFLIAHALGIGFGVSALVGLGAFCAGIGMSTGDQKFLAEVQARRAPLLAPAGTRSALAPGAPPPPQLTGRYRQSFDRVQKLSTELQREIAALPTGPLTDSIEDFLPQISEVVPEVAKLLTKAQRAENEVSGGTRASLEQEIAQVEAKVAKATDPEVQHQLQTALTRKREALAHIGNSGAALERIDAQVEAIASGLQEARARLAALATETTSLDASPARQAVEGVSRDVKFLAQAVRETEQFLIAP